MACYVPGCLGKFRIRIYTVWCADIDTLMIMELKQCLGNSEICTIYKFSLTSR